MAQQRYCRWQRYRRACCGCGVPTAAMASPAFRQARWRRSPRLWGQARRRFCRMPGRGKCCVFASSGVISRYCRSKRPIPVSLSPWLLGKPCCWITPVTKAMCRFPSARASQRLPAKPVMAASGRRRPRSPEPWRPRPSFCLRISATHGRWRPFRRSRISGPPRCTQAAWKNASSALPARSRCRRRCRSTARSRWPATPPCSCVTPPEKR